MPHVEGYIHLTEPVFDLAVLQNRLFCAGDERGVEVIRLGGGSQSFHHSYSFLGEAMILLLAVDPSRNLLYASDGRSKVWAIEMTTTIHALTGYSFEPCHEFEVPLVTMTANSGFLFLAHENGRVSVLQTQAGVRGFFETHGVCDLATQASILYVGLHQGQLQTWIVENDAADIASLFLTRQVETPGLQALTADGQSLYAACDGVVFEFDIATPHAPHKLRARPIDISPTCAKAVGRRLYLGTVSHGLWVTDIKDVNAAGEAELIPTRGTVWAVETLGDLAFAACGHQGLTVVNTAKWQFDSEVRESSV